MPSVEVRIDKNGKVKVEAKDFQGSSCTDKTDWIASLFGGAKETKLKPSYYEEGDNEGLLFEGAPDGGGLCG